MLSHTHTHTRTFFCRDIMHTGDTSGVSAVLSDHQKRTYRRPVYRWWRGGVVFRRRHGGWGVGDETNFA